MVTTAHTQNRYDHRLRDLVRSTRDIHCAIQHGVPPSTARGWLKAAAVQVVTIDVLHKDAIQLQQEVLRLRTRLRRLTALLRVLIVLLRLSGYSLNQSRLPDGKDKQSLLRVIERSCSALPLRRVLRFIHLSPSRYHSWNRTEKCALDDTPSCPQLSPQQLTATEVGLIHELVTSEEYRHVPTGTLAMFAQRMAYGKKTQPHCKSWPCLRLPLPANRRIRPDGSLFSPAEDADWTPNAPLQWITFGWEAST